VNPLVCHFLSGDAFFTGNGCVLVALLLMVTMRYRWLRRFALFFLLTGLLLITASATPLAFWLYAVALLVIVGWLWSETRPVSRLQPGLRAGTLVIVLTLIIAEWPHHRTAPLPRNDYRQLTVIGDSLSAVRVVARDIEPWPSLLAKRSIVTVVNLAQAGATLGSALQQATLATNTPAVILLEIGGNDLIAQIPRSQFAADLRALLTALHRPQRQLVMLELPLPPFANRYGMIQRALAREFNVALLPRRCFTAVLAGKTSTTDGLHLSPIGQQKMADTVWRFIEPLFAERHEPAPPAASVPSP
jgi:acyl-CoA thioesterase I